MVDYHRWFASVLPVHTERRAGMSFEPQVQVETYSTHSTYARARVIAEFPLKAAPVASNCRRRRARPKSRGKRGQSRHGRTLQRLTPEQGSIRADTGSDRTVRQDFAYDPLGQMRQQIT